MYQALITIDPATFVVQICNLMIQIFILKTFLLGPVSKVINERKALADSAVSSAEEARAQAENAQAEHEKTLAAAKAEASRIVADAQKTATALGDAIVSEARTTAAQMTARAEEEISLERKQAINQVKDEIGSMAMEIASKVVSREIDQQDHQALIDEFIRNVGEAS